MNVELTNNEAEFTLTVLENNKYAATPREMQGILQLVGSIKTKILNASKTENNKVHELKMRKDGNLELKEVKEGKKKDGK